MISQTDIRLMSVMIEKIDRLIEVCDKYNDDEIKSNYMLYDTIQFEFEKLYEDMTRLSMELRIEHPEFPIDKLRGIRNRVAHDYASVIVQVLIDAIRNNIPKLRETLVNFINNYQ